MAAGAATVRTAVLAQLPAAQHRQHCAELAHELRAWPGRSEGTEAVLAALEVSGGDQEAGTRRALRLIQRSYGFTLNFELMLVCSRICAAGQASGAERAASLLFTGLTHAFLGNSEMASDIFGAAYATCEPPAARAQVCYYLGLIATKRQGRLAQGRAWFERGLAHVAGRPSAAARLESGWLRNGMAMVAWREGRYGDAERLVRAAIDDIAETDETQLVNLRVNLTNNLSVLLEASGAYGTALETWRSLAPWGTVIPGGTFTKAFLYRESWLLLCLGDLSQAYASAVASWGVARQYRDLFHMDVISRACAYLACRRGDLDVAFAWAVVNLKLPGEVFRRPERAHAHGQLAHIRYQAGDRRGAVESLSAACRAAGNGVSARSFAAALAGLSAGRGPDVLGPDGSLLGITLDRPKAKLSTPFPLAQLMPEGNGGEAGR